MTNKIVVLDDIRNYPFKDTDDGLTIRNSQDCLEYLGLHTSIKTPIDELWLDFDLGGVFGQFELVDTAMPVALYLAECAFYGSPYPVKKIYIHTSNPVGRDAMYLLLMRFGYNVERTEAHFGV